MAKDIYNTPAMDAPDGQRTNLENPYSLHSHLVITASICLSLSIISVMMRMFTKVRILKNVQIDDYAIMLATAGFSAFTAVMVEAGEAGQGKHQWNVSIYGVQQVGKLANILEILYPPTMFAAKLALLLQIERIFTAHKKNCIFWAVHVLIYLNLLIYLATFLAFIFACWPREKIWNPQIPGRCLDSHAAIIVTSAINIISDVSILLLPLIGIIPLHLPIKKKLGVAAIFATGTFACVASIVRLAYSIKLTHSKDITWTIAPVGMWSLAEFTTVIVVACLPTFPRLFKFLRGKDESSSKNSYKNEYHNSNRERSGPPRSHVQISSSAPRTFYNGSYIPLDGLSKTKEMESETRENTTSV